MLTSLLWLSVTLWAARAQQINTIENANVSVTDAVPMYVSKAQRYWSGPGGVLETFDAVNAARMGAAMNTSSLFPSPADAAAVLTLLGTPVCDYTLNVTMYFVNEADAQTFICCHLAVLDAPGWDDVMGQLYRYFLGASYSPYSFSSRIIDQIFNVADLRAIETLAVDLTVCKDDDRINNPEAEQLRAQMIVQILAVILRTYNYITATAIKLSTCLAYPTLTTGCATNVGPILVGDINPNMQFVNSDLFFQNICGAIPIAAFNNYTQNKHTC